MKLKLPITEKFLWDLYRIFHQNSKGTSQGLYGTILDPYAMRGIIAGGRKFDAMQAAIYVKYRRKYGRIRFSKFIYYLKKKGYIEAKTWKERKAIVLTPKGFAKIFSKQNSAAELILRNDGKWQMVIFDIPEKLRKLRNQFRGRLRVLGYKQLQQSAWVSPYEVESQTKKIIGSLNLEDEVRIFIVESIQELELKELDE